MGFKGKSISIASYDAGNRLTAWNRAGADENHSQTWDYDDAGNWNSTTKDGDTQSRDHSVSNQITQLDGKAVSHDLKGNLTDYEYDRTDYRVKYDLDNRIVEVKADSETIRYRYDALGRRIVSKGDDETVLIWWRDSECAEYEHRASKDAIQNDIMGHPTRLNSVIARDTEDRENRVELQWYHKNYLDHVYAVSDDNGNLVEHYRYTAFGEPEIYSATGARRNTSAIANTVMWNTRRYDADNGLYYYKYRHYAANIGRWLGRDPIEEDGGINLYAFVGNQVFNYWDMLGLACDCQLEINLLGVASDRYFELLILVAELKELNLELGKKYGEEFRLFMNNLIGLGSTTLGTVLVGKDLRAAKQYAKQLEKLNWKLNKKGKKKRTRRRLTLLGALLAETSAATAAILQGEKAKKAKEELDKNNKKLIETQEKEKPLKEAVEKAEKALNICILSL